MSATRATMDAALKNLYLPRLRSTINTATVLANRLERNTEMTAVSGRQAIVPINIRPSEAIGARSDGADLPAAQYQTFVECAIPYAYNYARMRVTHPTIASTKNDAGAWAKVVSAEMEGIMRDVKNDFNRQMFGWGQGVLGKVASRSSQVITFETGHKVKVGMVIDIWDDLNLTTQDGDSLVVTVVSGNNVTVTGTVTNVGAGDYAFREDAADQEMMGLLGITCDGATNASIGAPYLVTLQGISRSTFPEWGGQVFDNGGTAREITAEIIDDAILQTEELGESVLTCGITDRVQFRKLGQMLAADRRYTDTMTLKGGFKAIEWGDIPIFWDRDCPIDTNGNSHIFLLDENEIQRYELQDMDWDDTDGSILHRVTDKASYDATLFYYGNLGCTAPDNQAVIRDLSRS